MGYTHYFSHKTISQDKWDKIVKAVSKILNDDSDILANGHGKFGTHPEITKGYISFNGIEDDAHETLRISRTPGKSPLERDFNSCKTARKPYDSVVVKVLQTCKDIAPESFELSSDGDGIFD